MGGVKKGRTLGGVRPFLGRSFWGRLAEDADGADLGGGHGGVLFVGAGAVDGGVWGGVAFLEEVVGGHPGFDFFTGDVGEHVAVDFDAGGEGLAAFLFHFPAEGGILDDVLFLVGEVVFAEDGADAFAPAAEGFHVSGDLGGFSGCAHDLLRCGIRVETSFGSGKCKWLGFGEVGEEAGFEAFGEDALEVGDAAVVGFGEDFAFVVSDGHEVHAVKGDGEFHADDAVDEEGVKGVVEGVDALAGEDGDGDGVGEEALEFAEAVGVDEVDFVEDEEGAFVGGAEFAEDFGGGLIELLGVGGTGVDDVDEEVGEDGLFEGGAEGLYEVVGEIADEADGVGEEEGLAVGEFEAAGGGVEGGEEFVFGEDFGFGEAIEEGGFADVGVTDDGGVGDGDAATLFAHGVALFFDFLEFGFDAVEAFVGESAVGFELGFAFAPSGGHAAAAGAA